MHFLFTRLSLSLFAIVISANASFSSPFSDNTWQALQPRQLRAASHEGTLRRRGNDCDLYQSAKIVYAEDDRTTSTLTTFSSTVKLDSNEPILVLEEFDHLFTNVQCSQSSIDLTFSSKETKRAAVIAWGRAGKGKVITSHHGCNKPEERAVFDLSEIESIGRTTIRLRTDRALWKDSFESISVEFGHSHERHVFQRDDQLVRKDTTVPVTVNSVAATMSTASSSGPSSSASTVSLPLVISVSPSPVVQTWESTSSLSSSSSFTIQSRVLNITIPTSSAPFPSATPLHFDLSSQKVDKGIELPIQNANISVGCKNCTTSGTLDLTAGSFVINLNNLFGMGDVIQNGTVMLSMTNGFQAHIELGTNVSAQGMFDISLFNLPIQGFTIPGLGRAGLTFSAGMSGEFNMSDKLQLGYGFEVNVPKNSSFVLDLADVAKSSLNGFAKTQLNSIPTTVNGSVSGNLAVAFKPTIPLGFEFFDGELAANVAIFLDAPALNLSLTQQHTPTNLTCKPDKNNVTTILSSELKLAVGIEAGLTLDIAKVPPKQRSGLGPALAALAGGVGILQSTTSIQLLDSTVATPTTCFGGIQQGWSTVQPTPTNASQSGNGTITLPLVSSTASERGSSLPSSSWSSSTTAAVTSTSGAVSTIIADVCATLLVVVAIVFVSL